MGQAIGSGLAPAWQLGGDGIPESVKRELIARVIASRSFSTAPRLTSFLLHVTELALQGRSDEITEYQIGTTLFGRPENYDPAVDGIVRSHASRLRIRLDQYFLQEGRDEVLHLRIPKGSYSPVFEKQKIQELQTLPPSATEKTDHRKPVPSRMEATSIPGGIPVADGGRHFAIATLLWALVLILTALLLGVSLGYLPQIRTASRNHPFWRQIFGASQPTLIVPGDSALVMWEALNGHNLSAYDYFQSHGEYQPSATLASDPISGEITRMAAWRYTSIVDVEVTQALTKIAMAQNSSLQIRYARDLKPDDFKQGNVILIGGAINDPWVQLFENNMNFVISVNQEAQTQQVINRNPTGQEPHSWDYYSGPGEPPTYSIVAYLPNLTGNGNVLLLEGIAIAGTQYAKDFVTDDHKLMAFLNQIRRADGTIPHFEVVLQVDKLASRAIGGKILAWRLYP